MRIQVPRDLSVMFCEESDALPVVPGSAYVDAAMSEVGAAGVELLCRVAEEPGIPVRRKLVAPRLVEGWSVDRITKREGGNEAN
jgi:DNA-binding LacI/PurR family transcriptional regulator